MANLMERRISDLAARMKLARDYKDRYVLLLGAGASMSSEVPPTPKIIAELLDEYGTMYEGASDKLEQFDQFWNETGDDTRHRYLKRYLDQKPSEGYKILADLAAQGYIRLIISFNFDILPQLAIEAAGQIKALELVNGYDPVDQIEKQIDSDQAGITIYQLHGSLRRPTSLKFSADDIVSYDKTTGEILNSLTARNIIVCGYAFEDFNVIKSFADFGKSLWWVNPTEPPRMFKAVQRKRNSADFVLGGEHGYFDNFFNKLHQELTEDKDQHQAGKNADHHNPFKFLASHKEADAKSLYYRAVSVRRLHEALQQHKPRTLHLSGKRMVGKTSLIRAGLLPRLKDTEFQPVYIRRCGTEIEKTLPEKIQQVTSAKIDAQNIEECLDELCKLHKGKHVVLILDQFERAISALGELPHAEGTETLDVLLTKPYENLTVMPVFIVDVHFGDDLYFAFANEHAYIQEKMYQDLKPLSQHEVGRIVRFQAKKADVDIPDDLLNQLIEQYDHKKFTLAHIETICHLLTARINLKQLQNEDLVAGSNLITALNSALVDHEILSYLEDLPIPEEQNLLRNVLLAASNNSRQNIAEYLKDNFRVMHSEQL